MGNFGNLFNPQSLAYKPPEPNEKRERFHFLHNRKRLVVIGLIIGVFAIGSGAFLYYTSHQKPKLTPDQIAQKEADQAFEAAQKKNQTMIAAAKEQINLPTNEDPILATVSDVTSLQNQDFFKESQNGDRILMYPKNKKAFLYRPSLKRVLAVAPLQYEVGKPSTASVAAEATADTNTVPGIPNPTIIPHGKILVQPH